MPATHTPRVFEGTHSTITIARPKPHIVVMTITGRDAGEHGNAPLRAMDEELLAGPFALYIDARKTQGASVDRRARGLDADLHGRRRVRRGPPAGDEVTR
jgi:hypothetical protein